jgi:hypothetical protein
VFELRPKVCMNELEWRGFREARFMVNKLPLQRIGDRGMEAATAKNI